MFKWLCLSLLTIILPLQAEIKILALSGSTRKDSTNKKLLNEAVSIARQQGATVTVIDLNDYPLPFYDGDLETSQGMPSKAKQLRQQMIANQAIIIASPEYNGSLSAVLKNAIDWASRDENGQPSRDAFQNKKIALLSTSPGKGGGARGLAHLRAILENVGAIVVPKQMALPSGYDAFDADGKLKSSEARLELQQVIQQLLN